MVANRALSGTRRGRRVTRSRRHLRAKGVTSFRNGGKILPKLLTKNLKGKRSERLEMERFLDGTLTTYERVAAKDGFPSNDLAYAFEYFMVHNYVIYNNLEDSREKKTKISKEDPLGSLAQHHLNQAKRIGMKINMAKEVAVYQQFRKHLSASPDIRKMTNRSKQQFAELLAVITGLNWKLYSLGVTRGDDNLIGQAQKIAKKNLEILTGKSADKLRITTGGIEFLR